MSVPYHELSRAPWASTTEAPDYEIRAATVEDATELDQLKSGPGGDASSGTERLSWRHGRESPTIVVAVHTPTGRIHAAFGTQPVRVRRDTGEDMTFGLVTVAAQHPASDYTDPPSLVVRCAWKHLEEFGGRDHQAVTYWNPALEDLRRGRRFGAPGHALEVEVIRTENLLRLPRSRFRDLYEGFPELTMDNAPPGALVSTLYERVSGDWGAGTVRDAAWYRWRYVERPGSAYDFGTVVGADGAPRALAVTTISPSGALMLLDWLCEPFDYEGGLALLRWAIDQAEASGCTELATVLPEWTPWFTHLQWNGLTVHESPWVTAARSASRRESGQWLRDRWFYTLGDLYLGSESATP